MTLQLLHSEFPYIRGNFFLFYQCGALSPISTSNLFALRRVQTFHLYILTLCICMANLIQGTIWPGTDIQIYTVLHAINGSAIVSHAKLVTNMRQHSWKKVGNIDSNNVHWLAFDRKIFIFVMVVIICLKFFPISRDRFTRIFPSVSEHSTVHDITSLGRCKRG